MIKHFYQHAHMFRFIIVSNFNHDGSVVRRILTEFIDFANYFCSFAVTMGIQGE